ncbi:hypothetical protein ABIB75_006831 [Bradyrhizobium sp. GM2.2]
MGEFLLIRAGTAQEASLFSSPLRACKMTQVCILCAVRFAIWINVQDDSCHFPPVGTLALRLQQTRVRHDMLLVIGGQR